MQGEGALPIGTQVSAKYKGAFCEAKVRSVDKLVKCRVTFKMGLGSTTISDKDIKTDKPLVQGATVLARHPDKQEYFEAIVKEIKDQSRYTVTFNDGDIATLRRNALCMKSGKHYNASESLDNLPLTHPEHFSTPVSGSRRRSGRAGPGGTGTPGSSTGGGPDSDDYDSSSDGEEISSSYLTNIGRVVWAENTDKKSKGKDTWFPALIVAPSASDTVKIDTKEEFLIRSFKDGRYYTVSKKDTNRFHKESAKKSEKEHLKDVIEKAVAYLERDELPPHWDKEILFNMGEESTTESSESEEIDDDDDTESPEEKDHLVAELYKHMEDRGAPINRTPMIDGREVDLYRLFKIVYKLGGHARVTNKNIWQQVAKKLGFETAWCTNQVRVHYKRYLLSFEQLNRTLGCTMRNRQSQQTSGGRSQIRGLHRSGGSKEALSPATSSLGHSGSICGDMQEVDKTEDKIETSVVSSPLLPPAQSTPTPIITLTSTLTPTTSLSDTPARMKTEISTMKTSSLKSKLDTVSLKPLKAEVTSVKANKTTPTVTTTDTVPLKPSKTDLVKNATKASKSDAIKSSKSDTIKASKSDVIKACKGEIVDAVALTPKSKPDNAPLKTPKTKPDSATTPKAKNENTKSKSDLSSLKSKAADSNPKVKPESKATKNESAAKSKSEVTPVKVKAEKKEEPVKKTKEPAVKIEPEDSPTKAREGRKGKFEKAAAAAIAAKERQNSKSKSEGVENTEVPPASKTTVPKKKAGSLTPTTPKAAPATPKPPSVNSKPTASKPSAVTPKPTAVAPKPTAVTPKPVAVTPKPAAATPKAAAATPKPVAVTPKPTAVTPKPAAVTPKEKEASSSSCSSNSSEKETKMTTRPRRDSTSSLAAAMQNKEKKDTIGDSNKRPFVRVDRDKDLEKEAKKLQVTKTAATAAIANTPPQSVLPAPLPPNSPVASPLNPPAPPSSKGDRDSSNERDSSADKRDSSRGRKKSGSGKVRQKIAKRDPAEDESMNGEEKQHLAPNVDVTVGDKIKVHYKRDTIYDAKVTKMQLEDGDKWPKYFVHYQGWNARYDEWIKRSRIADNLSWNKERAKKGLSTSSTSTSDSALLTETVEPPAENLDSTEATKAKETPLKRERSATKKIRGKNAISSTSKKNENNSRSVTPSSVTSKESRTGSPVLKRQTSRTSLKKEESESENSDSEEEDEEVTEPRKSSRLQKTPTSEKKKAGVPRKRPLPSKTESSETEVEVEAEEVIKDEPVLVVVDAPVTEDAIEEVEPTPVLTAETPSKETPTKNKRGRKSAAKIDTDDEKVEPPNQPNTPRASRGTPTRSRTPKAKASTPKAGRKGRGGSVVPDDEEDPYAFKEPEPFEEVKFETPRKSPSKKSLAAKEAKLSAGATEQSTNVIKPARCTKQESEESADSSSDEAGKKITAAMSRGRSRQKLVMTSESSSGGTTSDIEPAKDCEVEKEIDVPLAVVAPVEEKKVVEEAPVLNPEPVSEDEKVSPPVTVEEPKVETVVKEDEVEKVVEVLTPVVPEPKVSAVIDAPEAVVVPEKERVVELVKEEPILADDDDDDSEHELVIDTKAMDKPVEPISEVQGDQGRPVLLLSKKQQELFPHLAAIRTTSIPFSRVTATTVPTQTVKPTTALLTPTPKTPARSKSPAVPVPKPLPQTEAKPVEKEKDEIVVNEVIVPARVEPSKLPKPEEKLPEMTKLPVASPPLTTKLPVVSPPSTTSSSTASLNNKKTRKTPKKPNSSELVESDSDSGTDFDKKSSTSSSSKSAKTESIKSKVAKVGKNSNKRKEPPSADSGEDEPLGLRVLNSNKKMALVSNVTATAVGSTEKTDSKRSKQTPVATVTATVVPATVVITPASKKEDAEDFDLACAETIPGSPVHPSSGSVPSALTSNTNIPSNATSDVIAPTSIASRLEMPFASVPESVAASTITKTPTNLASLQQLPVAAVTSLPVKEETTDEDDAATTQMTVTTTTTSSSASQSPREEDNIERSKSPTESLEVDLDCVTGKLVEEAKRGIVAASGLKRKAPPSDVGSRSPMHSGKRKRRVRETPVARGRGGRGRHGSDRLKGDDDFEDEEHCHGKNTSHIPALGALDNDALAALAQRSPSSKKYNFFVDLDPSMDSSERISKIQNSLKELRKTYHTVKSELAVVERRRKKIRRKERERAEKGMPGNAVEAAA